MGSISYRGALVVKPFLEFLACVGLNLRLLLSSKASVFPFFLLAFVQAVVNTDCYYNKFSKFIGLILFSEFVLDVIFQSLIVLEHQWLVVPF